LTTKSKVTPFSLKDAPSLIERLWPAQKISVRPNASSMHTARRTADVVGVVLEGRKRLVYVRACVLAALLPATDQPERDLDIFEKLMAIDDRAFLFREVNARPSEIARLAIKGES